MTCANVREQATPERYLRGELTGGERDEYELHYFSCNDCYSELEALRLLGGELAAGWSRPKTVVAPNSRNWIWWAVPVAACIVMIAGVALTRKPHQPPQSHAAVQEVPKATPPAAVLDPQLLALTKFEAPAYREPILRSTAPAGRDFPEAMRLYLAGDYRGAAARLESLLSVERSPRIVFYAAACRMLNGDPTGAERGATQAIEMGETPYLEESYWLRAKARFTLGNAVAGRDDLRRLTSLKGDWAIRARELLRQSSEVR
jgi:hypothetical protein